jgi:hypothetical protein
MFLSSPRMNCQRENNEVYTYYGKEEFELAGLNLKFYIYKNPSFFILNF